MQFGFSPPVSGPLATPDNLARIAVEGEAIGYDYATISDHVVIPRDIEAKYPYSDTGEFPGRSRGDRHEQLTAAAFIAGKTSRLRLVTSVTVVPHRPAVLLAKMLATIDVLSKGRLTFGIGAGWMREEFEALGLPPFAERGAVTDEYLAAFQELWTKDAPAFNGKHVSFSDLLFYPKPVQKPHPPIWIGGESGPALRRTIRFAEAWYPGNNSQTMPLDTPARLAAGIAHVRKACEAAGRDPATMQVALLVQNYYEWEPHKIADGSARRLYTGSAADMIDDTGALADVGVGYVALRLGGDTVDDAVARIERFGAEVIARA